MVKHISPLCLECKHYHDKLYKADEDRICKAFPDGIPERIFYTSEIDHTEPVEGDGGIQFEEKT